MSLTVANVLEVVNEAFGIPGTNPWAETDIEVALKLCLADLATRHLLVKNTTGTVTVGVSSIIEVTQFFHVKSLVFTNSSSVAQRPTTLIPGDKKGFDNMLAMRLGNGVPQFHAEYLGKIYFFYPADGTYTYSLDYYARHLRVDNGAETTIEYPDEFLPAIQWGTCYYKARLRRNDVYIANFLAQYEAELLKHKNTV